jgi:hypothetical protein
VEKEDSYRRWPPYLRSVVLWFLLTTGIVIGTVLGIFNGIFLVMDYFLRDDRFYEGFAASIGISACGTIVLFIVVFLFIRKLGQYPRRKMMKGMRGT